MRVLVNCLSSRSGGAVAYLCNLLPLLSAELAKRGSALLTLTRSDQQHLIPDSVPDRDRLLVDAAKVQGISRLIWERRHLGKAARTAGAKVVFTPYQVGTHVANARNVSMLRNMEPFFAAQYPYTLTSQARNHVLRWQTRRFLHQSDAVIAVSDYVADYARTSLALNPECITRIYHGRDTRFSDTAPSADHAMLERLGVRDPYLFSCGSFLPYRRLEDVIEAFATFSARCVDHPLLVLAGSGTDTRYAKRIASLIGKGPVADRIRHVGQVDQTTMAALYRQSRLFVTSTEIEACPNIAVEAMSAGCRILSADIPVLREIFGSAATFYPARRSPALASAIEAAWMDEPASAALRKAARARSEDFSWQVCAYQTAELLLRVEPGR